MSQYKEGEIYTFKTTGGEEFVAKVTKQHSEGSYDYIEVTSPVSVVHNGQGLGLLQTLITADHRQSVKINTNNVLMFCESEENAKNKYIELTTGLKLPEKKLILG